MKIFLDLDGTLIDSRTRLHRLFLVLSGLDTTFEAYWEEKRAYRSNQWLLERAGWSTEAISNFLRQWMAQIESWEYLLLDHLYPGVDEALKGLSEDADLYIVTARQSKIHLDQQLQHLGIAVHFAAVLNTAQRNEKSVLIKSAGIDLSPGDFFIGDTGEDIETGRKMNLTTIAVTCGFRNGDSLKNHSPDFIVEDFREAARLILDLQSPPPSPSTTFIAP
ncbi:MAG: HAD family hydrolase [Verrucomicrobiae bacterium]|nr:HAD family hydrolase [Verrucomicrobiae bacterium]